MKLKTLVWLTVAILSANLLADEIVWSGDVKIAAGVEAICTDHSELTSLDIAEGATVYFQTPTAPTCNITGKGTLVKDIVDAWTPTTPIASFNGDYRIAKGIAYAGTVRFAFGNDNLPGKKLTVENGASLIVTDKLENLFWQTVLHLSGEGVLAEDGVTRRGALEMPGVQFTSTWINNIALDADATIVNKQGCIWFVNGSLKTNGHRLIVTGAGNMTIFTSNVPDDGGEIYVQSVDGTTWTKLTLRSWQNSNPTVKIPDGTSPFVLSGANTLEFYSGVQPVNRPLWLSGTNKISLSSNGRPTDSYATNSANWAGPVVFTNETGLSLLQIRNDIPGAVGDSNRILVVSGPISGRGGLEIESNLKNQRVGLLAKNSSYTGPTTIYNSNGSSVLLGYPGSVCNYRAVTNKNGFTDLAVGDEYDRWTLDDFYRFAGEAYWQGVNVMPRFSSEYTTNGLGPVKVDIVSTNGAGLYLAARDQVRFEGADNDEPWRFNWKYGKAVLTGPGKILLGESQLNFRGIAPADSEVRLADADVTLANDSNLLLGTLWDDGLRCSRLVISNSLLRVADPTQTFSTVRGGVLGASYQGDGTIEVLDGSVVTARVILATSDTGGAWNGRGRGALYQRGGTIVTISPSQVHEGSGIGMRQTSGHGYWEMTGGSLVARGFFSIGGYGMGIFAQYGGTVLMTNRLDQADGTAGEFRMGSCNQGKSVLYLKGGKFLLPHVGDIHFGRANTANGTHELTLDGPEALFDANKSITYLGCSDNSSNGRYVFNFNGGVYRGIGIQRHPQSRGHGDKFYVNFNGGTFRCTGWANLFGPATANVDDLADFSCPNVIVYQGGATIDTDGHDLYISSRISAPSENDPGCQGIREIRLAEPITGYNVTPRVLIEGDGEGASAFAHYDSTNGVIDAIVVTSPGQNYGEATAKLVMANDVVIKTLSTADGTVVLGDNGRTGPFVKKGAGTLSLRNAYNSWGGATEVRGGTLRTEAAYAIPDGTSVRLSGGATLDLNGCEAAIASIEYGPGGGKVVNAQNATLPETAAIALTVDDILADRTVAFAGDVDLSDLTIKISGAYPDDMPLANHTVLSATGVFLGEPTIEGPTLPERWRFVQEDSRLILKPTRPLTVLLR